MRNFILICGLLLHMLAVSSANAISQSITATDGAAGATPAFDYDQALAVSQAALGNEVGKHALIDTDANRLTLYQGRGKPLGGSMVFTRSSLSSSPRLAPASACAR